VNEYDAIVAMIERAAREEQDDLDQQHGRFILDALGDTKERHERGEDHLLEAIRRAHQAKAEKE
jgi:hypothetical protein